MLAKSILLFSALLLPCQVFAWIAYGFKSGMSRFDAAGHLADRQSLVVTEDSGHTLASSTDGGLRYELVYCASPQLLYLMRYRLPDSRAAFSKALQKFTGRYGEPEGIDEVSAVLESPAWESADISLLWSLNESETVLLARDRDGSRVEFQDVSVCR